MAIDWNDKSSWEWKNGKAVAKENLIVVWDKDNKQSLYGMMPPSIQARMDRLPGDIIEKSEQELVKMMPKEDVTEKLSAVRASFWIEYERATKSMTKMNISNVYRTVCGQMTFLAMVDNPVKLAYIIAPPTDRKAMYNALGEVAVSRLYEFVRLPVTNEDGSVDPKALAAVTKCIEIILNRAEGVAPQVIHQRLDKTSLSVNVEAKMEAPISLDEINKRLAEIQPFLTEQNKDQDATEKEEAKEVIATVENLE